MLCESFALTSILQHHVSASVPSFTPSPSPTSSVAILVDIPAVPIFLHKYNMVITGVDGGPTAPPAPLDPSALDTIADSQDALDELADTLAARLADLHSIQDAFEAAVKKQTRALKSANDNRVSAVAFRSCAAQQQPQQQQPKQQQPDDHATSTNSEVVEGDDVNDAELQFVERLDNLEQRLVASQRHMPSTGGWFVELFLGSINVRFPRKSERLSFKSEYERMKMKFAPFGVSFCILCLFLPNYRWTHMIFQLAASCYYINLAIRENILRVNGSNIRSWWIIHHYFTMMQSVLLLTWPNGSSYARLTASMHAFGLYNGVLMILQTRYQMARLYALRSLGMAGEMDVASSDNTQIHWSETMTLLLPLVILGQFMQGYMAFFLFFLYREYPTELQILFLAILFIANFIGNTLTTWQVVIHKRATGPQALSQRQLEKSNKESASTSSAATQSTASSAPSRQSHEKKS